jgi:hypothetical protein
MGASAAAEPSVASFPSIQAALDANPGAMVYVPPGDYRIQSKLRLRSSRSGLFGPGRILQENPEHPIIEIEGAEEVQLRDLTLTRPAGVMATAKEGILAIKCRDLVLENVRVIDNHSRAGAISIRESQGSRISRCLIRNYMAISIDDRTANPDWGYAFHCTDGTGVVVAYSTGTLIEGNRIIEERLRPTPEIQAENKLGQFAKRNPVKGNFVNEKIWDAGYTDNWQQGSGIIVTAPEVSDLTRVLGNHIENAAQGIDIHSDHVVIANNIVVNSFIGMKAMHGSRNVIITGNHFVKNSLWAIGLMPGAAAKEGNADGGSVVANNIISDFGHGDAHWIWGDERSPFKFDTGQQSDDPPLADVLVQGNLVQCVGQPRYRYAVTLPSGPDAPKDIHFSHNLFHPGTGGVANRELPE